jgi:glycosyltransferase involved in cell wall biosynthesis
MEPVLSVLMTSFNRERFIAEAIESVLASSFRDFELIVVDDCSADSTVKIARSYAEADQRLKVYVNDKNLGDYRNRNKAASYASGKYIMYVDSDDRILADGFERCVDAMNRFPHVGIGMYYKGESISPFLLAPEKVFKRHFFIEPCLMIGPGGTILRREFFERIGFYPEKYGPANDLYFNLKAANAGPILMLPFVFNFYRIHEGQELNNSYSYLYNNFIYLRDALNELNLPLSETEKSILMNKNRRRFLVNLVNYFFRTGNLSKTMAARSLADYGFMDVWKAIFNYPL